MIYCYNLITGKKVGAFKSNKEIAKEFDVDVSKIYGAMRASNTGVFTYYKLSKIDLGDAIEPMYKNINDYKDKSYEKNLKCKKVYQYDMGQNLIKEWNSVTEIVNAKIASRNAISNAIRTGSLLKNYYWRSDDNMELPKLNIPELIIIKKTEDVSGIDQYDLNGSYINTYPNLYSIEKILGYNRSNIKRCLDGIVDQAYGYIWKRS